MKNRIKTTSASIVIPVYNNEKTLIEQIKLCEIAIKSCTNDYEILICEDKSIDLSRKYLIDNFSNSSKVKLFFNRTNLGIAKNFLKLYKNAKKEYIISFSVDGDWNPSDIQRLYKTATRAQADIVIGKRKYSNYSLYRKFISRMYNFLSVVLFQVNTIDAGSIKAIRKDTFINTKLISKSVLMEAELIIRTIKNGGKVLTIPVSFNKRDKGHGAGANIKLVAGSVWDLILLRLKI